MYAVKRFKFKVVNSRLFFTFVVMCDSNYDWTTWFSLSRRSSANVTSVHKAVVSTSE